MNVSATTLNRFFMMFTVLLAVLLLISPASSSRNDAMTLNLGSAVATSQENQGQRRVLKRSDFSPPVRISRVKTEKGPIKFDEAFIDYDDDWFKGFTVEVINESGKTINYIEIEIIFQQTTKDHKPPAIWTMAYGISPFKQQSAQASLGKVTPIPPGDPGEIELSDHDFGQLKYFLSLAGFPDSIDRLEVRVTALGFVDGTSWRFGQMLKRDPSHPSGWSPPSRKEDETPSPSSSDGSAQNRTAFF